jgi:hypothetical protein
MLRPQLVRFLEDESTDSRAGDIAGLNGFDRSNGIVDVGHELLDALNSRRER